MPMQASLIAMLEEKSCGANRDRTGDLLVANETLSQLSYSPGVKVKFKPKSKFLNLN
jgi:hypothetical protein